MLYTICVALCTRQVSLRHAPAEETNEPSNKFDLATLCLVNHESPEWVSKAMFKEAYRVLRPGGVFTILDLDKNNLAILLENPFVAAVYKQVRGNTWINDHSRVDFVQLPGRKMNGSVSLN